MSDEETTGPPMTSDQFDVADDLDDLDEEWLQGAAPRSRLRVVLVCLLAAAIVFLAGVEVQKQYGSSSAGGSTAGGGFAGGFAGAGSPGGGTLGQRFSGTPGGPTAGGGTTGRSGTSQSGGNNSAGSGKTLVIGTVKAEKGDLWTIKDLGGTLHRIQVAATTKVTVKGHAAKAALVTVGQTVEVSATSSLTASSITVR